ncbi:hypothetical protein F383_12402 [Gossypium arboreum]|uniref:Uncharacterized protein n=1 Tax=Gossypium arboreum TaxID=29729 RepID=A0A0B0NBW2_GOSAR|nr:hypothetical protein F383_12402 [Gossypium arboreum]
MSKFRNSKKFLKKYDPPFLLISK